jgi:ABC-type transporter Mla subunit MlaD
MEGTEQAKRTKWTTIRVSEETASAIKLLSERWQLSAGQVIDRLLQLYEAYLESDNAVQSVVNALETLATEPAKSSPPLVEPEASAAPASDELRQVVADMLYVMEAAIDMLGTIISVYPDLRAECAPIFDRLTKRFDEVATAWNLLPASAAAESALEQPPEQPAVSPGGAPGEPGGSEPEE